MNDFIWYKDDSPKLNVINKGGVTYLTSPLYDDLDFINSGFSTRLGGVSEGFLSSMNFAYNEYDKPENVYKNYEIFCNATGIDINRIVTPKQVHGNKVVVVGENHEFRSVRELGCDFPSVDGLITNVKGATLFAFSADCCLVQIVDPVNRAVGSCHAGWRGTVSRITENAIKMMNENYGTKAEDLLVSLMPSICPECFEVEWDMISEARKGFSESDYDKIYYQKNEKKYQFNLWEANKIVLKEAGVKESNIFSPNLCTRCNHETLFSHRIQGLKRGTLISFISIQ